VTVRPPSNPVLEVIGLRHFRRGLEVLRGVSAGFERGVVTAVVGPSGAGKTSLLRCLNRLDEPRAGRVLFEGRDLRGLDPTELRRQVGMIFQTPVLFDGGVRANLGYGLSEADDERLGAALGLAGLPASFLDRPSSALSVGQAQRVCIARALVRSPQVLLMDEPTSALDKGASARIESLVTSLADSGLTVVLVTHDLAQARRVAHWALLLVAGGLVAWGGVDEIEQNWEERRWS
jgi:putative ABC transport system ATP-binding protein